MTLTSTASTITFSSRGTSDVAPTITLTNSGGDQDAGAQNYWFGDDQLMQDKDASAKTLRFDQTPAGFHLTGDFYRYSFIDGRPSGDRGINDWRGAREHRQPVTDDRDDHRANLLWKKIAAWVTPVREPRLLEARTIA